MSYVRKITWLFVVVGITASLKLSASPINYKIFSAEKDQYAKYSGGHSFWMPSLSRNLRFEDGATGYGTLVIDDMTGVAKIFGEIRSKSNTSKGFNVDITLTDMELIPVDGGKRELKSVGSGTVYTNLGGTLVDTSTWIGFNTVEGTLTGIGTYDGLDYSVSRRGPTAQFGIGASGKNVDLGFSTWLDFDRTKGTMGPSYIYGDINVGASPAPEPGTLALVGVGLLGIGLPLSIN